MAEVVAKRTEPACRGVEALRTFATLVETHRYYGSVAATSRECLLLQQEKLPGLFDCENDTCCTAPSLVLATPAAAAAAAAPPAAAVPGSNSTTTTTNASGSGSSPQNSTATTSLTNTAQQRMDIPVSFTKDRITELPLHLLEGCTRIFQVLWKTRLQFMASTLTGPKLGVLDQAPLHPSAVVTLIRCLDAVPTKEEGLKLVLPIILSLVMDWKLQDGTTSTIRMEFPGILIGRLSTKSSSASLHHVEIDLQSGAMLKSMAEQLKTFADKVLMVGWVAQTRQRVMSRLMPRDTTANGCNNDDSKEEVDDDEEQGEGDYAHAATTTPLQALFSSADQPVEPRQDANATTTNSPEISSSTNSAAASGQNNLSVLSAAADQVQRADAANRALEEESPAKKKQKTDVHGVPSVAL